MMPNPTEVTGDAVGVVTRLLDATNAHDLSTLTDCFAADYTNDTPAHPFRSFTGREQVRANWQQLFASIPDLRASIVGMVVDSTSGSRSIAGTIVWTEWRMTGTLPDGSAHEMAGVILFTIRDAEIVHGTFYLETVERGSGTVDDNIRRVTVASTQETGATP
jgi:ketosteroid isomerase-like protein